MPAKAKTFALQQASSPSDDETLSEARAWLTNVDEQIRFLFELSIDIAVRRGTELERLKMSRYCKTQEVYGHPCEGCLLESSEHLYVTAMGAYLCGECADNEGEE